MDQQQTHNCTSSRGERERNDHGKWASRNFDKTPQCSKFKIQSVPQTTHMTGPYGSVLHSINAMQPKRHGGILSPSPPALPLHVRRSGRSLGAKAGNLQLTADSAISFTSLSSFFRHTCINLSRVVTHTLQVMFSTAHHETEVCSKSADPHLTMHWIKEVEIGKSIDELRTSRSIVVRTDFPDYDTLDAMIASSLKKLLNTHVHFRKRTSVDEQRAQKNTTDSYGEDKLLA